MKINRISILLTLNFIFLTMLLFFIFVRNSIKIEKVNAQVLEKDVYRVKKVDYKNENIVFFGDSITDWYPFDELYEESVPIVNSGRAGSRTFDLLPQMEELVYRYNPTKVFILIGTNDLNTNCSKEELVENIEKMIRGIQKERSRCKIYVQSIYPVNKDREDNQENHVIQEVNQNIKKICKKYHVTYINMYDELIDQEGRLASKYTTDGLHISSLGYIKITKKLEKYIE